MEELEIRQNVIALHNDLRTVNMPDQYKSLFVSILMLDEVEMLVKNDTEQLMADISCVIARRFSGEQAERISEKFTKSCTVSLIRERKSCEEYSLWWFLQQLQKIKSQLKETNMDAISLFYGEGNQCAAWRLNSGYLLRNRSFVERSIPLQRRRYAIWL